MGDRIAHIPPHSLEMEQSLLGGLMVDQSALPDVIDILKGDEFYRESHRMIYAAILDCYENGAEPDIIAVSDTLHNSGKLEACGGASYIAALSESMASSQNAPVYAGHIMEKAQLRKLIQISHEVSTWCYSGEKKPKEILESAEAAIFAITNQALKNRYATMREIVEVNVELFRAMKEGTRFTGIPSGYHDLDKLTGGFQKSDLIILAARPSMGKTALALCIAQNAAKESKAVTGFFSLEMSKEQLGQRLMCADARVSLMRARTGSASHEQYDRIITNSKGVAQLSILVDDTPAISPLELRAKTRRMVADHGLNMVIVDYLQLMSGGPRKESREQEISNISRSLKGLAKELNIPVIALSQLNRKVEERTDKRPMLSDLRESGAIEQDADVIVFIYRDEVYNKDTKEPGVAEVIIGKQRNGPTGDIRLAYQANTTRFESYAGSL